MSTKAPKWPASVQARKNAQGEVVKWRVMWRDADGSQRSTSFDVDQLPAANRLMRRIQSLGPEDVTALRTAHTQSAGIPTLTEWTEHHIEHLTGVTPGTRDEYRRLAARSFLVRLGDYPVDTITRDMVARWVNWQAEQVTRRGTPTAPKSIRSQHGLLHAVMDSAALAGHRPDNPCHKMRLPQGEKYEPVFLSREEFFRILDHLDGKHRALAFTIGSTGLRWGEATALRWAHVELDGPMPQLRVVQAWKKAPNGRVLGPPKSKMSRRTLGLNADVIKALRPLREAAGGDTELFVFRGQARNGNTNTAISHTNWHGKIWRPAVVAAGIDRPVRIHDLRHSFASWLLNDGHELFKVQAALGHESITTTTGTYGHIAPDAHALTAEAIRRILTRELAEDLDRYDDDVVDAEVIEVPALEP